MRLEDWHLRLDELVHDRANCPYEWGYHDCVMWAAAAVEAVTGRDLGLGKRLTYSTEHGAARMLVLEGVRDVAELADKYLGRRRHIAQARHGDIVVGHLSTGELCLGACLGRKSAFVGSAAGQDGLIAVETLDLDHCYRV